MVSKVAVIALVAIIATPILLGYAMNMDETTYNEYKPNNNPTDVTPLLWNSTEYTYAYIDAYQLNSNIQWTAVNSGLYKTIPIFNTYTTNFTSYPLTAEIYYNQSWDGAIQDLNYKYFYEQFDYDPLNNSHDAHLYGMVGGVEQLIAVISNVHSLYYDQVAEKYSYTYYNGLDSSSLTFIDGTGELTKVVLYSYVGAADVYVTHYSSGTYADMADGFYFKGTFNNYAVYPENSKSGLYTINLDSITDPNYAVALTNTFESFKLIKTTTDGVVSWKVQLGNGDIIDLYYDPSRNDNTYQVFIDLVNTGQYTNLGGTVFNRYEMRTTFRYVGGWPTTIGEANYYLTYKSVATGSYAVSGNQPIIALGFVNEYSVDRSPTMRIDGGTYGSMTFKVIKGNTYNPATFKSNPSTTISDIRIYGTSLIFAEQTYNVTNGNIMLGTHEVSVSNLVFDSIPVVGGGYENRINGNVISITPEPSTLTFDGVWLATVKTDAMEVQTVTKTEWIPGQFAWDGIDHNFLLVGLFTSLAAFIGIGIYMRRSKAALWPLLLVTGGAAFLFLIMM